MVENMGYLYSIEQESSVDYGCAMRRAERIHGGMDIIQMNRSALLNWTWLQTIFVVSSHPVKKTRNLWSDCGRLYRVGMQDGQRITPYGGCAADLDIGKCQETVSELHMSSYAGPWKYAGRMIFADCFWSYWSTGLLTNPTPWDSYGWYGV